MDQPLGVKDNEPANENAPGLRHRHGGDSEATSSLPAAPTQNYKDANEYAQFVRTWLWAYHSWYLSQCIAPLAITQTMINLSQHATTESQRVTGVPLIAQAAAARPADQRGGREYTVPAFGRRIAAEAIDFLFCFILKLLISYSLVEFGIIDLDKYERLLSGESDFKTFIDVTQELFPIEILNKLATSLVEAFYTSYGLGSVPAGATPGKFLMGLRVIVCHDARPVSNVPSDPRVVVSPVGVRVPFGLSLLRALFKNFSLGFLFPVCVGMYIFRFGRALYDIVAYTIVVEA